MGDARKIVYDQLSGVADRVIMNLPETAHEFIDVACNAIKSSCGIIHYYGFVRAPDTIESFQQRFCDAVEKAGRKVAQFNYVKDRQRNSTLRVASRFRCKNSLGLHDKGDYSFLIRVF